MALASQQVVHAVASAITGAGVTPAGARVYTSRAHPIDVADVPCWRVLAADETIEPLTLDEPALLQHTLSIDLQGYVKAAADVDEAMGDMAEAALEALLGDDADTSLGLGVQQLLPTGISRDMAMGDQAALGRVAVQIEAVFQTRADAPGAIVT